MVKVVNSTSCKHADNNKYRVCAMIYECVSMVKVVTTTSSMLRKLGEELTFVCTAEITFCF